MSTTTTHDAQDPESDSQREERIHPFRLFDSHERRISLLCFLIALVTYWSTVMPNIGLNDDGEMATAALHFGVMHPSGYPLWTILADTCFALVCVWLWYVIVSSIYIHT